MGQSGQSLRPAVADVSQQRRGRSTKTRDLVTGFVDGLALTGATERTARIVPPQRPGEVMAAFAFTLAGLRWRLEPIGEAIRNHLSSFAATVFHRN